MKWQFTDLAKDQDLSLKISEELKNSVISSYIVSLESTGDDVSDIGKMISAQCELIVKFIIVFWKYFDRGKICNLAIIEGK